jgi:hypothetical protein
MKKSILILALSLSFSFAHGQIKEIKMFGSTINVYGTNGEKTGSYMLQNNDEKLLGNNSQYFLLQRMRTLLVMNNKGFQYATKAISLANGNEFVKITDKSIWIKNGPMMYYYDFNGSRLSNFQE